MSDIWYNSADYRFNPFFEQNYKIIAQEAEYLFETSQFEPHENSIESNRPASKLASGWEILPILRKGAPTRGSHRAPETLKFVTSFPEITTCEKGLVYFSYIPPHGKVAPHVSGWKPRERIRHQLCLCTSGDRATITVGGETRTWTEGKVLTFDDAFSHSVDNDSDQSRIVLLYDSNAVPIKPMQPPSFAPIFCTMYPEMATIARKHGWCLAVHGTMGRDFDLICTPWWTFAADPQRILDELCATFGMTVGENGTRKSHGRVAYTLLLGAPTGYVDISFMPRFSYPQGATS